MTIFVKNKYTLQIDDFKFKCCIGKKGSTINKKEGDKKTPKGTFDQRVIPYHIECDYFIELHCKFPKWKDFIETLAHEMVHLYQMTWLKDPYSNHNANFFAWKNKFKNAGLNLTRC